MSVGFRKSLFGFNREDVMTYINNTHTTYSKKEADFNNRIDGLNSTVSDLNSKLGNLELVKSELERQLKEYTDKYDEIERLSKNIGKLYLVAQANARAIMKSGTESRNLSHKEVEKNLYSIDKAHESLDELKAKIVETSNNFVGEVEELMASLNTAKEQINENNISEEEKINSFCSLYSELTK